MRTIVTVILAAALLAGCGSEAEDDTAARNAYVRAVNAVQDRFHASLERAQKALDTPTATGAQERRALRRLRQAVDHAIADLRGTRPPAEVAAPHRRLVEALEAYGPVIAARRAASRSGSTRVIIAASTSFTTGSEAVNARVQRAIEQINARL